MTKTNLMEEDLKSLGYQMQMKDRWATILFNHSEKTIVCSLNSEYIPIADFKSTFYKISMLVQNGHFEKLIFDKRSLKAFHQPSMEWYFVVWKKEMLLYGLKKHRKILPHEEWFRNAVRIARAQLVEKYPDLLSNLDIKYCNDVYEAINS